MQTKQSDNGVAVTASKSEKAPVGEVSKWPAVISRLTPSWGLFVWYSFLFFLASIATGFIGISIEKMTFIVATWGTHGMHVRSVQCVA